MASKSRAGKNYEIKTKKRTCLCQRDKCVNARLRYHSYCPKKDPSHFPENTENSPITEASVDAYAIRSLSFINSGDLRRQMLGDDFRHETAAAFQQTRLSVNRHTHLLFPSLHTYIIDIHYIKISDNCQVCKFKIIRFIIYFFCAITTYTRDYESTDSRTTVKSFIFSQIFSIF